MFLLIALQQDNQYLSSLLSQRPSLDIASALDAPARQAALDALLRAAANDAPLGCVRVSSVWPVGTDIGPLHARVGHSLTISLPKDRRLAGNRPFSVKLTKQDLDDRNQAPGAAAGLEFKVEEFGGFLTITLVDLQVGDAGHYRIDCHNDVGGFRKAFSLQVDPAPLHCLILMDTDINAASRRRQSGSRQFL